MRTENNHNARPEAGRAKIPVNFIVIFLFCLLLILPSLSIAGKTSVPAIGSGEIEITTVCVDGYKFAVAIHNSHGKYKTHGLTLVQMYHPGSGINRPPQPIKCK